MQTERPHALAVSADSAEASEAANAPRGLLSSDESYQLLVESVQEYAIFMLDPTSCIVTWNVGAQRIFGYDEAEVLGQTGALIFTKEDRQAGAVEDEITTALRTGKAEDERWHVRKDGSRFWATGVLTRLDAPDGSLRGFAKILRDNTERRLAEEAQQALMATLETQVEERTAQVRTLASLLTLAEQEERRRLAQILHDDLQQCLYGIQIKLLFISDSVAASVQPDLAVHAQEAYKWLNDAIKIVRQLTVDLSPPVLQGEGLVDALTWLATNLQKVYGFTMVLDAEHNFVDINEDMRVLLFQIIRELLFNVIKHADIDHAMVTLREEASDRLTITVEDAGCGFDIESAEARHEGGFGLFSVRERVNLFGGHMVIHAVPGQGTRITLSLPSIAPASAPAPPTPGGELT